MKRTYLFIGAFIMMAGGGWLVASACNRLFSGENPQEKIRAGLVVRDTITRVETIVKPNRLVSVGEILFLPGRTIVPRSQRETLERILAEVRAHPAMVLVLDGFSDPSGGRWVDNNVLASKRALVLYRYFLANGVKKEKVFMRSFGASTRAGREPIRRVEVSLLEVYR